MGQSFKCLVHLVIQSLADSTWILYWRKWKSFTIRNDQAKDVQLLHGNASSHKCEVVKSSLASEKEKVLIHPPYSPDLSTCDFFLFPRLKKMLSGNKYASRSSLGSAIYQCLQQVPKEDCFSRLDKQVTKVCFSKGGILWVFVIKICLIKRSTEVIRTQWQNFLQDLRTRLSRNCWCVWICLFMVIIFHVIRYNFLCRFCCV